MPKEGDLAASSFCEVLADLSLRHETGVLRLSGTTPSKSVYLQEGKIVFASSTDPDDRLGELLLTRGIISRGQLDEASKSLKPEKRLGTALVEQGFLPASDLPKWVREQVKEILFSLFSWTEGKFVFEAGPFPSDEAITLRLSTPEIFLSGLKMVQKWSVLRKGAGEIRIPYQLAGDPRSLLKEVSLSEEEERLLRLLQSRPLTMEQAALESGLTTLRVYQLFFAFRVLRVVVPAKAPAAPPRPAPRASEAPAAQALEVEVPSAARRDEAPAEIARAEAPAVVRAADKPARAAAPAEKPSSPDPAPPEIDTAPPAVPEVGSQTIMLNLAELPENDPIEPALAELQESSVAIVPGALDVVREVPARSAPVQAAAGNSPPAAIRRPAAAPEARVTAAPAAKAAITTRPPIPRPSPSTGAAATQGPPPLPTAADAPALSAAAAAAKRNKPDLRVVKLDDRRLEGEGPQHLEDLVRQWILKGYRLAGVVPARASGLFGSPGSTYLIFTRETSG